MQLTLYTDYSLRVLVYLGINRDRLSTISEIAQSYRISRNHLVKVVHNLSVQGYVKATRGKGGGLSLARPPGNINIGDVVRHTEMNFNIVECFNSADNRCPITPTCLLKGVLHNALGAFMEVLDRYTLADIIKNDAELARRLGPQRITDAG